MDNEEKVNNADDRQQNKSAVELYENGVDQHQVYSQQEANVMFKSLHGVEAMKRLAVATQYSGEVQAVTQSGSLLKKGGEPTDANQPQMTTPKANHNHGGGSAMDKHARQSNHHSNNNRDHSDQKGENIRSANRSPIKAFSHTIDRQHVVKALTESNLN